MAYNLQTLITIVKQILDPQQKCRIHDYSKPPLNSLLEKAISLQQILEKSPSLPNLENLEREIRDAAHKAEDIIESHMVDRVNRMLSASLIREWLIKWCKCFTFSSLDLQLNQELNQVTQELDSAMEQVRKLVEMEAAGKKIISSTLRGTTSSSGGAAAASLNPKSARSIMVGFDEDLMELKDRLTGMQSKLEIIPIVGMGGAGKTTLARNLYEDPLILYHFVARAWTTVSQDYNMRTILLSLLSCITRKQVVDGDVSELKDRLYQSLFGRRYLIVLDDIWSTQVWDEMRMFFPDNKNGSRIVITTRESHVAAYANSQSRQHAVQLLSESASWNLLRQIVFGGDDCPRELESIGGKIASGCGGLPLAITVIGGLLSKVGGSEDVWEDIADNVRGAIAKSDDGEQYSSILSLSYKHLPNYLKPCFLYMGSFPEDYEMKGSELICYWIAEGFIKSNRDKSLEEVAEEYLTGLVERNLLIARRNKLICKPSYVIHDVLRDLCIMKADEENFLHVMTEDHGLGMISKLRRVSSEQRYSDGTEDTYAASTELMSLARSFRYRDNKNWWEPSPVISYISSVSNLLRVLDIMNLMRFQEFPNEILQLVNLRYLGLNCKRLCVGISRLVNLQILINRCEVGWYVPSEIWKMSGLRYLKFSVEYFDSEDDEIEMLVEMNKLQTLSCVKLTESLLESGFLQSIPNIKTLGILWASKQVLDLSHLHKLETLTCRRFYREDCRFPPTLRKLTLDGCCVYPHMVTTLCGLPNLEVLKIKRCSLFLKSAEARNETNSVGFRFCHFYMNRRREGNEWELREGEEFRSLQLLQLDNLDLVRWSADETNFPKLRHLFLQNCQQLEEIPSGIGEISTLELIEMKKCSFSSVESAKQIVEEQHSEYGNYALQLRVHECTATFMIHSMKKALFYKKVRQLMLMQAAQVGVE